MESYQLIGGLTSGFVLLVQCMMFWLQARALRRHGHRSFLFLSAGSALGIIFSAPCACLYLLQTSPEAYRATVLGSTALILVSAVLGVIGTWQLFQSYARLAAEAGPGSVAGT